MCVTYGDVGMFHALSTIEEVKPGYLKKHDFKVWARGMVGGRGCLSAKGHRIQRQGRQG